MISGIIHLLCFAVVGTRDAALGDDHMCTTYEKYVETVPVTKTVPVKNSVTEWCFRLYPRCTTEYTTYKRRTTYESVTKIRPVQKCCEGYLKSKANGECLPVCSGQCLHGECIAPESCSCNSGYYGHRCDKPCTVGFWGRGCLETCDCEHDSECDAVHGLCECSEGWQGVRCDVPCDKGHFGKSCEFRCDCETCDHVTGECEKTTTESTTEAETTTADDVSIPSDMRSSEGNETVGYKTTEPQQTEWTENATDKWEREVLDEANQTTFHYDANDTVVVATERPNTITSVKNLSVICGVAGFVFLLIVGIVMIGHFRKTRKVSYSCKNNDLRQKDIAVRRLSSETAHPVKPVFDAFTYSTTMDLTIEKPRMITFKPVRGDRPLGEQTNH